MERLFYVMEKLRFRVGSSNSTSAVREMTRLRAKSLLIKSNSVETTPVVLAR